MLLTYFSPFYFIYPVLCLGAFFGLYFGLKNAGKKTQYWVLFGITLFNFALHFLKLAFPPYVQDLPASVREVAFENICAVSTLVFPLLFLSKKPVLLDYMFYIGVVSGIASMFAPMNIIGLNVYDFETIRFYICHGSLWTVPLLMVIFGLHKLDYHRIWKMPFLYYMCLLIILFNEVILNVTGWVGDGTMESFLSTEYRNSAFIFGPPANMEGVAQFLLVLTPSFFKPGKYIDFYMPILWEVIPVYIYGTIYMLALSAIWEHAHMAQDWRNLTKKAAIKFRRHKIKNYKRSKYTPPKRRYGNAKRYKCK